MFGGAGLLGLYAVGALVAAAILGLSIAVTPWLAALIVAAMLGAAAACWRLTGKSKVEQATPPVPEQATEQREGGRAVGKEPSEGRLAGERASRAARRLISATG